MTRMIRIELSTVIPIPNSLLSVKILSVTKAIDKPRERAMKGSPIATGTRKPGPRIPTVVGIKQAKRAAVYVRASFGQIAKDSQKER